MLLRAKSFESILGFAFFLRIGKKNSTKGNWVKDILGFNLIKVLGAYLGA
jgi:hypothetical protein